MTRSSVIFSATIVFALILLAPAATTPAQAESDLRRFQHGIDFVPLPNGMYYLIWSSAGHPPKFSTNWRHDIYYAQIDPADPVIEPLEIIANPEAQEPASAAITADGHIMITMEDGWNTDHEVAQRYGVYDVEMQPALPYPQMVQDGGHSGHVAAVGNRFVVFYSDEWVSGGGVDNLGSGDDVLVKIYNARGEFERGLDVAVGSDTRDWWPLLTGSDERALLVWQRFVDERIYADLIFALLDPASGKLLVPPTRLEKQIEYYTYSVEYVPAIERFLVTGTYKTGDGFAYLLDNNGKVTAAHELLPAIVRESQPVVQAIDGSALAVQPTSPTGLMVLVLTGDSITLNQVIADKTRWQYMGTDGIFTGPNTVYMVSLSKDGLVEQTFTIAVHPIPVSKSAPTSEESAIPAETRDGIPPGGLLSAGLVGAIFGGLAVWTATRKRKIL